MRLAPVLLIYVGTLTGMNAPLGKLAASAGVPAPVWALVVSAGASLPLFAWLALRARLALPRGATARYVVLAGGITFVAANLVLFLALPHVGAGHMGLMFALSPLFTLALASALRMQAPGRIGLWGLALGFAGAVLIALTRGGVSQGMLWSLAALAMPALLAAGNVYRSLAWPEGGDPIALAAWSHLVAVGVFAAAIVVMGLPVGALAQVPLVTGTQILLSAITFPAFFLLQRLGGPVMLSQLGYVAAASGVLVAVTVLDEAFGPLAWVGAGLIALGVGFTVQDQRQGGLAAESRRAIGRT
ncbi:DMT family transporter [Mesobacterium sp. TK19101]|uniref:DMT family transporter n=2 Tax=Mesobacterium hydrothermale TaxID=3111907 RepID=A0ABU6HMA0_9RHOB|nr:DMT family transporter [Mesobacterium sp. TK19101]